MYIKSDIGRDGVMVNYCCMRCGDHFPHFAGLPNSALIAAVCSGFSCEPRVLNRFFHTMQHNFSIQ